MRWRKRHEFRTEKKIKSRAADQQERMRHKPEFVCSSSLDLFGRLFFACGSSQLFADFRFFGNLLCGLGHQLLIALVRNDERHCSAVGKAVSAANFESCGRLCLPPGFGRYAVLTQHRSTSATLQACAMQPPSACGSFASNTSLTVPSPASPKCCGSSCRNFRAFALSFG